MVIPHGIHIHLRVLLHSTVMMQRTAKNAYKPYTSEVPDSHKQHMHLSITLS